MNTDLNGSGRVSARLGFIASLALGALFLLYAVCFAGILMNGPAFIWKDLQSFLQFSKDDDQTLKYVAYAGMLIFGFVWVVLAESVALRAEGWRKPFARLGAAFGSLFALASGANYFVQLTGVRFSIASGDTEGLSQLVMANPVSAMESVNMLGWTFLLGVSCLFLAFALEGGKSAKAARIALLATGIVCIAGGFGFSLNCTLLVGLCMYPLLGGGLIAASTALAFHFRGGMRTAS